jgi:hypothetical protein
MTKSEQYLRYIIREEVRSMLITERFGSQILTKLHSTTVPKGYLDNKHTNKWAFGALSKKYGIKWDNITDKNIKKSNRLTNKGLEIIVATKDGSVRPTNAWAGTTHIKKGQMLGVSMDGKRVWMGGGYEKSSVARTGQGARGGNIGLDARGFNKLDQLLKIDVKPIVLQVDHKAGGDASIDRASREEAKAGAVALIDAKKVKQENIDRYRTALKRAAGAEGIKPIQKMFADITKLYVKVLEEKTKKMQQGFVQEGWTNTWSLVTNAYDNMTRSMEQYLRYAADIEATKKKNIGKAGYDPSEWMTDSLSGSAREIKDAYNKMKKQLANLAKDNKYKEFQKVKGRGY